jgi:archaellum component FlaC
MLILDRQAFEGQLNSCWDLHDACEVALVVSDSLLNVKAEIIDLQTESINTLREEVENLEDKIKRRNRWLMFSGVALVVSVF